MGRRGYGYGRRYYRRSRSGDGGGRVFAALLILFIGFMKQIAAFVLSINAFVIAYFTIRYKISKAYSLESLSAYKKKFLFSFFIALGSFVLSFLTNTPDMRSLAYANIILAVFAYILTAVGIMIFNWIRRKDGKQITSEKDDLNYNNNYEDSDVIPNTNVKLEYEDKVQDDGTSANEYEFNIPSKTDAELRGEYGELIVAGVLSKLPAHYKVISGVLLEYEPNVFSQIDHLVISNFGTFVIETKNYSGYICGKAQDDDWTQVLYGKNNEQQVRHMPNPIKQNISHIKALQKILTKFPIYYHNIVVFTGNCKIERIEGTTPVVHVMKLLETIRDLSQVKYLSNEQVMEIFATINRLNRPEMIEEHVNRLNKYRTS